MLVARAPRGGSRLIESPDYKFKSETTVGLFDFYVKPERFVYSLYLFFSPLTHPPLISPLSL